MSEYITPEIFSEMFVSGTRSLEKQKAYINELNVFPVPDGDTGTNMALTLNSAIGALAKLNEPYSLNEAARAVSNGALHGARGNSGVIMSQLIRGFSKGTEGLESLDKVSVARSMQIADEMARKAVADPKEGTILTVARSAAKKANEICKDDISMEAFFKEIIAYSDYTLSRTPEMLPVLKEAGVVDSGGQGLLEFFKGAYAAFTGSAPEYEIKSDDIVKMSFSSHVIVDSSDIETSDIKFTYCTEFIVDLDEPLSLERRVAFKKYLEQLGDSLVFVCTDEMAKIHVHTNHPGLAFEKGLEFGSLSSMKIDNMKQEHKEKLEIEEENRLPLKEYGFVSVCSGSGIKEIFNNLSVDVIVEGGQTMNPSAEDIARAAKKAGASSVFVLPNNSNVILTASQAKELCPDIELLVIPTKNAAEGISAVIDYQPALNAKDNAVHMTKAIENIKTAEITTSIRDSEIEGVKIRKDDYMALSGGHMITSCTDLKECALKAAGAICDEDTEIISIYYGADTDEDLAGEVADAIEDLFEDADVDLICGGQPVYEFMISAE